MFSASADLYDLIYASFKDYPAEARHVAEIIRREQPAARSILDVACGTGEHARLLTEEHGFEVDGLDLDPAFVRIAAAKLPKGHVYKGDMTEFSLEGRYDALICLFSAIGYVRTLENVIKAFRLFRAHLAPGGVVLVEPWFPPGVLEPGRISVKTAERDGVSIARMSQLRVEDRLSRLRFEYLIGREGTIEHAVEIHDLGLFTPEEMLASFVAAGFAATLDPVGVSDRGLYVARAAR